MQQCSETEHCSSVGLKDRSKQLKALGASEQPSDHLSLVKARKRETGRLDISGKSSRHRTWCEEVKLATRQGPGQSDWVEVMAIIKVLDAE